MYIVGFPLLLGPLVTVHELGHYLVGRWFGVQAQAFSIGFGKEILGWTDSRGTRWKLSVLPLGGYVQFKGDMNPSSMPERAPEKQDFDGTFHNASLWKRALIVLAGPMTNLVVTILIIAGFFTLIGRPVPVSPERQLTIASFTDTSPARKAGLKLGDRIVAIDGKTMTDFRDVQDAVMLYPDRTLGITVERDGTARTIDVTTESFEQKDRFGNLSKIGLIGVVPEGVKFDYRPEGPIQSVISATEYSADMVRMMVTGIGQIFTGERSVRELGGPVKIAKFSGEFLSLGPLAFLNFVALISINLAFINLLPIPGLDGGHLAFYAAEAVRRKPVGPRGQEMAYRTGMALVLMLMIFVTINDLVSLPVFGN
ncbi:RIP metalloprotease RseP [Porphyrobacter algicida]|uniref:Zinc metalloprotease n=1 Tax=Qipengyuania algicida TaxID=1836209 RepID=A0A845AED5_9SPHN|nr:RIP metalloprotease RseP [Qipengyuania algicida]MXP27321.1 RIP metalloprotease RseP [Qipengyuania algicida]